MFVHPVLLCNINVTGINSTSSCLFGLKSFVLVRRCCQLHRQQNLNFT